MSEPSAPWQLLPALAADEYEALKADIATNGVRVAVVLDAESGAVVDGHHRVRAVEELRGEGLSIDYPRDVRAFASDDERLSFVLAANLFRRHLTPAKRAELVGQLRRRGWSVRKIAGALGVPRSTVGGDLMIVRDRTIEDEPERVSRRGGGTYPARRPRLTPSILVHSERHERRARAAFETMGTSVPERSLVLRDAEKLARKAAYERLRETSAPTTHERGERWELRAGDFVDVLGELPASSVDMVLCDPPYTAEFDERWGELSEAASRVLKTGAAAVFYSGHHNLPDVLGELGRHLTWLWHVAIVQPGQESRMNHVHVHNGHRDLLVLTKGPYKPRRWLRDTLTLRTQADKRLHPWQQQIPGARYLIDILCERGGLVVDPCCGAATFGVAALQSGRRFLGIDVDEVTLAIAAKRLREGDQENGRSA